MTELQWTIFVLGMLVGAGATHLDLYLSDKFTGSKK